MTAIVLRFLNLIFAVLAAAPALLATAQQPDLLMVDGKEKWLFCNPLEPLFIKHPERRPSMRGSNSSLGRGYIVTLEIIDGTLCVRDVRTPMWSRDPKDDGKTVSALSHAFPEEAQRKLTWFTGILILPEGKEVDYVHTGYSSTYEGYRLIYIQAGQKKLERVFNREEYLEYKARQFEAFRQSERFKQLKEAMLKESGSSVPVSDGFFFEFDTDFPMETVIDHKDFRPLGTSPMSATNR